VVIPEPVISGETKAIIVANFVSAKFTHAGISKISRKLSQTIQLNHPQIQTNPHKTHNHKQKRKTQNTQKKEQENSQN
jgi:hypothetical protein